MKTCFTICFTLLFTVIINAQQENYNVVSAKQVESTLHSDATIHFDGSKQNAGFKVIEHDGEEIEVATVFAGGIWMSTEVSSDTIAVITPTYGGLGAGDDYQPGPFNFDGGFGFDEVWKVSGEEIRAFLTDIEDGNIDDEIPLNIQRWPATGNVYYGSVMNDIILAPFFDVNGDGKYDPFDGDYPVIGENFEDVIPSEMIYTVSHPSTAITGLLQLNLHSIMFSLECEQSSILDRALFTRHRIDVLTDNYTDFRFGLWMDMDLGCYVDDFVGSSPNTNSFYAYNADPVDGFDDAGNCLSGINSFDIAPAVHGTKFLNRNMDVFAAVINGAIADPHPATLSPQTAEESYRIMHGFWRDGTPFTYGGTGYDLGSTDVVNYLFPDDPSDSEGWSLYNDSGFIYDYRTIATTDMGTIEGGQSYYIDMVNVVTLDESYDHLNKVQLNQEELNTIQQAYNDGFQMNCGIVNKNVMEEMKTDFSVQPNPNMGNFTVNGPEEFTDYVVYNMVGKTVEMGKMKEGIAEMQLIVPAGMYLVRLYNDRIQTQVEKFVIVK